jgi:hypothetical protein
MNFQKMETKLIEVKSVCFNCKEPFDSDQQIVNAKNEIYHQHCFV